MLMTIELRGEPDLDARDLGFLVAKHPDRATRFSVPFGSAWVGFPVAEADRARMALWIEADPPSEQGSDPARSIWEYVNDRGFAASSLLGTAISKVWGLHTWVDQVSKKVLKGFTFAILSLF